VPNGYGLHASLPELQAQYWQWQLALWVGTRGSRRWQAALDKPWFSVLERI
jgi:hypothetical protein